jgi:hypothetical protein
MKQLQDLSGANRLRNSKEASIGPDTIHHWKLNHEREADIRLFHCSLKQLEGQIVFI